MSIAERRNRVAFLLKMRYPNLTQMIIDNGVWLADNEYEFSPYVGCWRKPFGKTMVVIRPHVLETFNQENFQKFVKKQEFLAKSGRIPLEDNELLITGEN